MMTRKFPNYIGVLNLILSAAVLVILALIISGTIETQRIRYVRSSDLVYNYAGMNEAQNSFNRKKAGWQARIDTLKAEYEAEWSRYIQQVENLSEQKRTEKEKSLAIQRERVLDYSQNLAKRSQEEEQVMLEGVLNQINSFTRSYAIEKGYDLVYGTTSGGSLLYGKESLDITDELLAALNKHYRGEY